MIPSRKQPRKRRNLLFSMDMLEERRVMSAGMGSTFAIVPGAVAEPGQTSTVEIRIDPKHFSGGRGGRMVVGIDVAADPNSTVKPTVVGVRGANGRPAAMIQRSLYSQAVIKSAQLGSPVSSAVTTVLRVPRADQEPITYKIDVRGQAEETGDYLLGFYLPGDVNGDGVVDKNDIQLIGSKLGRISTDDGYSFDADANRDGQINVMDLRIASQNLGARTSISPVVNVNLDPATDGPMQSRITNHRVVRFNGSTSPDANITFAELNGRSPGATTVSDADGNYVIDVELGDGPNNFQVTTADSFGQTISGQISPVTWMANPPTVVNTPPPLA